MMVAKLTSYRVLVLALCLSGFVGAVWTRSATPHGVPNRHVAIEPLSRPSAELTSANLSAISELVVTGAVLGKANYAIRDEPHRVASLNAEQQRIADGGYRVVELSLNVLQTHKGSSPSSIFAVRGIDGPSVKMSANQLIDVVDISVGAVYKFYLVPDPIWFQGTNHYVLLATELGT
jgi:hypothetical protein